MKVKRDDWDYKEEVPKKKKGEYVYRGPTHCCYCARKKIIGDLQCECAKAAGTWIERKRA